MKTHNLKINISFADDVLSGDKSFEVRENDRGYQKGDHIKYTTVGNTGLQIPHQIEEKEYVITYVLSGWGIKKGYVVFGQREIK